MDFDNHRLEADLEHKSHLTGRISGKDCSGHGVKSRHPNIISSRTATESLLPEFRLRTSEAVLTYS